MTDPIAALSRASIDRRTLLLGGLAAGGASLLSSGRAVAAAEAGLRAQRLAWAGIRLQLPGATLFIDPLINAKIWKSSLKDQMIPVGGSTGDRFVLITHRHPDHFDPLAVAEALKEGGTLVYPSPMAPPRVPEGIGLRTGAMWEPLLLGDFTATPVPASDGYGDLQVSWVVTGGGKRILHAGDTGWHGNWWHVGRQYGPFDAVFLPVNGAKFKWRQPVSDVSAVLTPHQAVAAAVILGARKLVPIHYGITGADGYAEVADPIGELRREAAKRSIPVEVLTPGAWLDLT